MNWGILSKYRTQLMGIACIWIMLSHNIFLWSEPNAFKTFVDQGNVGVDIFLILSGIGLYYSFSRDEKVLPFYKRRIVRLLIPYFIISVPYYLWFATIGPGEYSFISYITQYAFVKHGVVTTWFIPCIFVLSLLFPLIYFLQNKRIRIGNYTIPRNVMTGIICLAYFFFTLYIREFHNALYKHTEIALLRGLIFIIGCHIALYVKRSRKLPTGFILFCASFIFIYTYVFTYDIDLYIFWYRLSYIPLSIAWVFVFSFIFYQVETKAKKQRMPVLSFFGKRSLELYMVHVMLRNIYTYYNGVCALSDNGVLDYLLVIAISVVVCIPLHLLIKKISGIILNW